MSFATSARKHFSTLVPLPRLPAPHFLTTLGFATRRRCGSSSNRRHLALGIAGCGRHARKRTRLALVGKRRCTWRAHSVPHCCAGIEHSCAAWTGMPGGARGIRRRVCCAEKTSRTRTAVAVCCCAEILRRKCLRYRRRSRWTAGASRRCGCGGGCGGHRGARCRWRLCACG